MYSRAAVAGGGDVRRRRAGFLSDSEREAGRFVRDRQRGNADSEVWKARAQGVLEGSPWTFPAHLANWGMRNAMTGVARMPGWSGRGSGSDVRGAELGPELEDRVRAENDMMSYVEQQERTAPGWENFEESSAAMRRPFLGDMIEFDDLTKYTPDEQRAIANNKTIAEFGVPGAYAAAKLGKMGADSVGGFLTRLGANAKAVDKVGGLANRVAGYAAPLSFAGTAGVSTAASYTGEQDYKSVRDRTSFAAAIPSLAGLGFIGLRAAGRQGMALARRAREGVDKTLRRAADSEVVKEFERVMKNGDATLGQREEAGRSLFYAAFDNPRFNRGRIAVLARQFVDAGIDSPSRMRAIMQAGEGARVRSRQVEAKLSLFFDEFEKIVKSRFASATPQERADIMMNNADIPHLADDLDNLSSPTAGRDMSRETALARGRASVAPAGEAQQNRLRGAEEAAAAANDTRMLPNDRASQSARTGGAILRNKQESADSIDAEFFAARDLASGISVPTPLRTREEMADFVSPHQTTPFLNKLLSWRKKAMAGKGEDKGMIPAELLMDYYNHINELHNRGALDNASKRLAGRVQREILAALQKGAPEAGAAFVGAVKKAKGHSEAFTHGTRAQVARAAARSDSGAIPPILSDVGDINPDRLQQTVRALGDDFDSLSSQLVSEVHHLVVGGRGGASAAAGKIARLLDGGNNRSLFNTDEAVLKRQDLRRREQTAQTPTGAAADAAGHSRRLGVLPSQLDGVLRDAARTEVMRMLDGGRGDGADFVLGMIGNEQYTKVIRGLLDGQSGGRDLLARRAVEAIITQRPNSRNSARVMNNLDLLMTPEKAKQVRQWADDAGGDVHRAYTNLYGMHADDGGLRLSGTHLRYLRRMFGDKAALDLAAHRFVRHFGNRADTGAPNLEKMNDILSRNAESFNLSGGRADDQEFAAALYRRVVEKRDELVLDAIGRQDGSLAAMWEAAAGGLSQNRPGAAESFAGAMERTGVRDWGERSTGLRGRMEQQAASVGDIDAALEKLAAGRSAKSLAAAKVLRQDTMKRMREAIVMDGHRGLQSHLEKYGAAYKRILGPRQYAELGTIAKILATRDQLKGALGKQQGNRFLELMEHMGIQPHRIIARMYHQSMGRTGGVWSAGVTAMDAMKGQNPKAVLGRVEEALVIDGILGAAVESAPARRAMLDALLGGDEKAMTKAEKFLRGYLRNNKLVHTGFGQRGGSEATPEELKEAYLYADDEDREAIRRRLESAHGARAAGVLAGVNGVRNRVYETGE